MSRIRVLRVQSRICVGGPALNTILLSDHLDPERYATVLVGGKLDEGEKSMVPKAEARGIRVTIIDEMGRAIRWTDDLRALRKLTRLIRDYRPHIVHTHTAKAGAIGRVAAFLCRVPVRIHTFHGHIFHGYFSTLVTRCFILLERMLSMISTRVVVISPRQSEELVHLYKVIPARKCRIVRLGFELDHITSGEAGVFRTELGVDEDIRLVGIVARLVPIKNHQLLLHAIAVWRNMVTSPVRFRFLIIGDGELRSQLESLVEELSIADLVIFTGWRSDVPNIYADLDLNVLVSKNEGTPVTLIEGLACGVPVLSTDVGGVRDFVDDDCGVIVPPDITPEALAEHLREILARPVIRLDEAATHRIREIYGVQRLVTDMQNLYEELLPPKLGRSGTAQTP